MSIIHHCEYFCHFELSSSFEHYSTLFVLFINSPNHYSTFYVLFINSTKNCSTFFVSFIISFKHYSTFLYYLSFQPSIIQHWWPSYNEIIIYFCLFSRNFVEHRHSVKKTREISIYVLKITLQFIFFSTNTSAVCYMLRIILQTKWLKLYEINDITYFHFYV